MKQTENTNTPTIHVCNHPNSYEKIKMTLNRVVHTYSNINTIK